MTDEDEAVAEPFTALPFPTLRSALDALDQAPPSAFIEESGGVFFLLIPVRA